MKLADLKWAAGMFVSAALRPAGHEDCECHPKLGYRGPRSDGTGSDGFQPERADEAGGDEMGVSARAGGDSV